MMYYHILKELKSRVDDFFTAQQKLYVAGWSCTNNFAGFF